MPDTVLTYRVGHFYIVGSILAVVYARQGRLFFLLCYFLPLTSYLFYAFSGSKTAAMI